MELGNAIFGNSRGEFPIERSAFEGPWKRFTEVLKIDWRGYPDEGCLVPGDWELDTPVFHVRPYDWDAECDCGAEAKMDAWHDANVHGPDCYQTELSARLKSWEDRSGYTAANAAAFGYNDNLMSGFNATTEKVEPGITVMSFEPRSDEAMRAYRKLSSRRRVIEQKLFAELSTKHSVDPLYGAAVHCTCGRDNRAEIAWGMIGGHADGCRLIQPNFLYKPTGFQLNWYKYPFRDSYMSTALTPERWAAMLADCTTSVTASLTVSDTREVTKGVSPGTTEPKAEPPLITPEIQHKDEGL